MSYSAKDDSKNDSYKNRQISGLNADLGSISSNDYHSFILNKSERLSSAIYVITGFMPADEPIRSRLRVCALDLITRSANPLEIADTGADSFEYRCIEISSILNTARYAGLISEMNAKLIREEYRGLAAFVRAHKVRITERGPVLERAEIAEPKHRGQFKGHSPIKRHIKAVNNVFYKKDESTNGRKELILSIFHSKSEISIKDTVSVIPGVSEKTLQRDLLSLVGRGVLVKKGARRWTTYLLAPGRSGGSGV